ncbi:MAG: glycosyltransferase family 4 protein [Acetobacteraceae bacterium]
MNIVFLHQNMPGQFRHLIHRLARDAEHRVVCIGRRRDYAPPGIGRVTYDLPDSALAGPNPLLTPLETAVRHGLQVARACEALAGNGFRPDLIVAHPGWGESLYVKEIFPAAPLLQYCEFYYQAHGADVNFDPADQQDLLTNCATRTRNAPLSLALSAGDWGMSPTHWQKQLHPAVFQPRISVRFDGIDTDTARPDPAARLTLAGQCFRAGDEVITFVARSLEPYRGFPSFMRAIPDILRRLPDARVVVVGSDDVSYGKPPPDGTTWRAVMQAEVPTDPARVIFAGRISFPEYIRLLQVSAAHVYLTVPFVLSWSMLEAMAAGCVVIGSATPPVQEVIEDGRNGYLVDFFSPEMIADRVVGVVKNRADNDAVRQAARWTALSRYALERCLPRQIALLEAVSAGRPPDPP